MRTARILPVALATLVAAVCAPVAAAGPAADFDAVAKDYRPDAKITPCRFTQAQLVNALNLIPPDFTSYAPDFKAAVKREILRWRSGDCPAAGVQIVSVRPKGGVRTESVLLRNRGSRAVDLRGDRLRNRAGRTIRLKRTTLKAGSRLRVFTGCGTGSRPRRKGARYFACKTSELWKDSGGVVKLLSADGSLLSQKRY